MSLLSKLGPTAGSKKRMKRVGRGDASGHGGTSTRGHKGQKSRAGRGKIKPGFEGGQMPLHRRSPKWGFTNIFKVSYEVVNLADLEAKFSDGASVTPELLAKSRLISSAKARVKVLGQGKLSRALKVKAHAFSASAKQAIESAKGEASLIEKPKSKAA